MFPVEVPFTINEAPELILKEVPLLTKLFKIVSDLSESIITPQKVGY